MECDSSSTGPHRYRRGFLQSLRYACSGLTVLWTSQSNMRRHVAVAGLVIAVGWASSLALWEWLLLVLCIGIVSVVEAVNTAIELLADAVHPEEHPMIGRAKDVAAAGVLLAALTAAVVGLLIFVPRLTQFASGG